MVKWFAGLGLCALLFLAQGVAWSAGDTVSKNGPMVKTTPTQKGKESKIRVFLPSAEAKLYFDDMLTKATGTERSFRSPALEADTRYCYKVIARWVENGREVTHETKIVFRAGEDVAVDFRR